MMQAFYILIWIMLLPTRHKLAVGFHLLFIMQVYIIR